MYLDEGSTIGHRASTNDELLAPTESIHHPQPNLSPILGPIARLCAPEHKAQGFAADLQMGYAVRIIGHMIAEN